MKTTALLNPEQLGGAMMAFASDMNNGLLTRQHVTEVSRPTSSAYRDEAKAAVWDVLKERTDLTKGCPAHVTAQEFNDCMGAIFDAINDLFHADAYTQEYTGDEE